MTDLSNQTQTRPSGPLVSVDQHLLIRLVFWLALPLVWSIPTIYYRAQADGLGVLPFETLAVVLHVYIMWVCAFGLTWLLARVPVLAKTNPYLLILAGGILGITLVARYAIRALLLFRVSFAENSEYLRSQIYEAAPVLFAVDIGFFAFLAEAYWFRVFCWTISAWFFFAMFRTPHFGLSFQQPTSELSRSEPTPFILTKLRPELGREILALKAEGHFTRVYTKLGDELLYYKFGDAVAQMPESEGTQVHRSYWVNTRQVETGKGTRGKTTLTLPNALKVPVGQTYMHHLRERGVID